MKEVKAKQKRDNLTDNTLFKERKKKKTSRGKKKQKDKNKRMKDKLSGSKTDMGEPDRPYTIFLPAS